MKIKNGLKCVPEQEKGPTGNLSAMLQNRGCRSGSKRCHVSVLFCSGMVNEKKQSEMERLLLHNQFPDDSCKNDRCNSSIGHARAAVHTGLCKTSGMFSRTSGDDRNHDVACGCISRRNACGNLVFRTF